MVKANNAMSPVASATTPIESAIHITSDLQKLQLGGDFSPKPLAQTLNRLMLQGFSTEIDDATKGDSVENKDSATRNQAASCDKENSCHQRNSTPLQQQANGGHPLVAATPHSNASFPVEMRKRRQHALERLSPPFKAQTPIKARKSLVF